MKGMRKEGLLLGINDVWGGFPRCLCVGAPDSAAETKERAQKQTEQILRWRGIL